ncbi:DEAD/DEAH box helicase [Streptomyces sp. NPDC045251]|uniref:DEAD/DEAH box helicase n=1 Tax=unclassified Streptomyces TaxID=2593676 RepID=UPI003402D76A
MTLPVALSGTDVIGQAKTGTGKTLGFGLPLLERVTVPADVEAGRAAPEALTDAPQALVVVPTRELCQQVTNDLLTAGKVRNVRVTAIYGGRAYEPQVEALKKGVDVIVGTPGRLLDLAGQKKLSLKHVKCLVLDEADEMLDLGFLPDVEKIINMLPARRQTMLFSATMPGAVIGLARRYMSQPTHIRATSPDDEGATVANTKQFIYRAHNMDKPEMVARILQAEGRGLAMVFCRTKRTAADLADQLKQRGFASGAVHGDLGQGAREQALRAFRNGKVDVLVCTDVAARGIDVEGVTHVINYQSPEEEKTYLHRIGRTGRAGAKGTAITLVDWDDIPRWQLINKALQLDFNDPPETYSTSPHFYTDLGIPEGTKGVLPRSERTRAGLDAEELEDLGEPGGRGGRTRGDRGDRGGRGGRDESRSADRERAPRTPRRRRRMRGGAPVDADAAATTAPGAVTGGADRAADAGQEASQGPRTLRRRRRTRGGEPAQQPVTPATADAPAAPAVADPAPVVPDAADATEAPAKPRRRRTRKSAEAQVSAVEATPVVEAPVVEAAPVAEAPAQKPRRRTRKAATTAETVVDTAEAATEVAPEPTEAKPRRARKTATAKAAAATETAEAIGTAVQAPESAEAKPKARRTRKTAAATEATAEIPAQPAQEPEAAEAKPRRTRKTAATKAETATDTAEATEAKPRRTRKAAAAKTETATDTAEAEAEAKPKARRTRKTAAATEATEAAVQAPETAEAKPRRTRKTAAAKTETAANTTEAEAEAKPKARRTRKTAAAAEKATEATAEIPAQSAQEPEAAPRRRTRKAATTVEAPAEAADTAEAKPKARRTRKTAAAATRPADSPESGES